MNHLEPTPKHGNQCPLNCCLTISQIDLTRDLFDQEAIRRLQLSAVGRWEHLNGVVYVDPEPGRMVGYKNVREDEFWVPWHIPERPLLPGVLMKLRRRRSWPHFTRVRS